MSNNKRHDKSVDYIVSHHEDYGIIKPRMIGKEVRLYDASGKLIGEPDIIAYGYNKSITLIEYSQIYNPIRAQEQLDRAEHMMKHKFGPKADITKLFVHGYNKEKMIIK